MIFGRKSRVDRFMQGLEACRKQARAVLIDCRTFAEFGGGAVPGAVNIPVDQISLVTGRYPEKDRPLYLYCRSGQRSEAGKGILEHLGYTAVTNLGGILDYKVAEDQFDL